MSLNLLDKKLKYWEHQLLDLGKRNKMINYRETKRTTIKLVEPSFGELFDRIALNEEILTFQRAVDRETDIRVFSILSLLENLSAPLPVAIGDIKTEGSVLERQRTLKNLRTKSRLALEEQGTNILYLSFGFIEWKDGNGASTPWIKSPLILVPAVLALESLNSPFTLKKHEDDIVVNPTLEYYLKTEYGINLPPFDSDKDSLDDYLKSLEVIADQRGWRILREVSLGLLSFLKISMYNDLLRNEERIKNNPVIRAIAGDYTEANKIPEYLNSFKLDSISTKDCYQVLSADSSQQEAILFSKNNVSFVMQGPPGTGKSQTITNIIAEALAEGKKVLFVSEKMAALQVVYRRLQESHLGDFCLPLHSYKANKKEILKQIGANLKLKQPRVKDNAINNLEELLAVRNDLNKYAAELHAPNSELNISCYEVYSKLEEVNDAPTVTFAFENPLVVSQSDLQSYLNVLKEYSLSLKRLYNFIKNNPWDGLSSRISGYEYSEKMRSELSALNTNLTSHLNMIGSVPECEELTNELKYMTVPILAEALQQIGNLPDVPAVWLADFNIPKAISTAKEAGLFYRKLFTLQEQIEQVFNSNIYEYDYNKWKESLSVITVGFIGIPLIAGETSDYLINNVTNLLSVFSKIKDHLSSANIAVSEINNLLGTNFISNTYSQQIITDILVLIKDNIILLKRWFITDIDKTKILVKEAKRTASNLKRNKEELLKEGEVKIISLEKDIEQVFNKCIYEYDYIEWKESLSGIANGFIGMPLIAEKNSDYFINNVTNLLSVFTKIKDHLSSANIAVSEINSLLGTNFKSNTYSQQTITDILVLIKDNFIVKKHWFDADISKIKALVIDAKNMANQLRICKEKILSNWESDILLLDYSPILLRYKTDYTSIFKLFNSQYRKDKKQIQGLSKNIIKKLPDDIAVDILISLKDYHEKTAWFDNKDKELSNALASYYTGIDSDWDIVLTALDAAEKLSQLPADSVSSRLIELLSADHKAQIETLESLLSTVKTSLVQAREIVSNSPLSINIDSPDFDSDSTVTEINAYIAKLNELSEQKNLIKPYLNNGNEQIERVYSTIDKLNSYVDTKKLLSILSADYNKYDDSTLENLPTELFSLFKEYIDNINWFDDNGKKLSNALASYYTGIDSDWGIVLTALDTVEKLSQLPADSVSSRLIELLSADHKAQIETLESLLSAVKTSFAQAREIVSNSPLSINMDSPDFDSDRTVTEINACIAKLNELSEQKNLIKSYLNNSDEQIERVYSTIDKLNLYFDTYKLLSNLSENYTRLFDFLFTDSTTDWDGIVDLLNKLAEIKQSPLYEVLLPIINVSAKRKQSLKELSKDLSETFKAGQNSYKWVQDQFSPDVSFALLPIKVLSEKISGCLENIDSLESWIDYCEAKEDCNNRGLSDFIGKIEEAEFFTDIEKIFLKGFYRMWLGAVFDNSATLRRFRRNAHDEKIKKFIELDDHQLLIAQMRIREKLIENLPSTHHMLKATDEVAILNKELSKKRKIMPLRKLFRLIPNLLMKLKPCLMMSPLSVSYFLETEAYHFDLVIFDEASQIFPEDAIGAIFRGSQVIIAGDSKQLPPTNFFASTTNNFDGDYDIKDEEDYSEVVSDSILEESASVLPNRTLLWHYRSKHENLIAFSNREIYNNNLITFPNSINNIPDMGVEYIYVQDGYYDRGGKKCNIREAQECVRLVFEHIKKHPDRSLGIIAFSENQQAAIENAIIDYRERNPKCEWFFDESREEPFFVKNLENVQGDERDTIIFSICYAKDINGKMYMNFGPLGHEGGERRLNVAITRAKCNIKLFGSILPSDIDLNRAKSDGARMLRSYIEYARNGMSALKPVKKAESFESEDDFCDIVAKFLVEHGYKIEKQVGCSDYKIDIAIVNPNAEGEYIAGIECDGLSYIHAKTARDRDHLRRSVLENMGWNMYRVWSTEWIRNPETEGEALLNFIMGVYDKNGNVTHAVKQSNADDDDVSIESIATETVTISRKVPSQNPYGFSFYREANWREAHHSGSRDNLTRISENIIHIVSIEQPIHMELLYKRMGPSFTTGKATERVKITIDQAIAQKFGGRLFVDKDRFVRLLPLTPITVRIPKKYETPRPIEYIHTEEVAMAMIKIVQNSFGITVDDLASECARAFGFERKGPKIKTKTDTAIKYLIDKGQVRIIDGKVQLTGERL